MVDVCVVNTRSISKRALQPYRVQDAQPVENDTDMLRRMGLKVVEVDLLRMIGRQIGDKIRHDPGAVAAVAMELAQESRRKRKGRGGA